MRRRLVILMLVVAGLTTPADRKREARRLQKTSERLEKLSRMESPLPENQFLHTRAAELLERAKAAQSGSYAQERLREAAENLLEASEEIQKSRPKERDPDDNREAAAKKLERSYFRLQQADYFARLSGEKDAGAYSEMARRLYQQARSAYDAREFTRARRLAEASDDVVEALEDLAHATVRIPDPPRLK